MILQEILLSLNRGLEIQDLYKKNYNSKINGGVTTDINQLSRGLEI